MSGLRAAAERYLTLRRALGFKLTRHGRLLFDFVAYLEIAGAATVSTEAALTWATQPQGVDPSWWSQRLSVARCFARHLQAVDPHAEVPPAGLLPHGPRRAPTYLYSHADIVGLLSAAQALIPPLRAATYHTFVGLIAVTGMRVSEAIALDRGDVDLGEGLLTVRHAKFDKARQLPVHATTIDALAAYATVRDEHFPRPNTPAFFVSTSGARLCYGTVHATFRGLIRRVGLEPRSERCRPRPHDLRHSFAVRTLIDWYEAGADVAARLPLLSTYLGHVNPANTYWYLSAAPELLALAAGRLDDAMGPLP